MGIDMQGNAMWSLHQKLKAFSKELSKWPKECIRNVIDKVMVLEHEINHLEDLYDIDDSDHNREALHRTQAKYIKWLKQ
ncbi:hypothetical protein KY285_011160 [Solanum tuberosum]|nr:hypothetical protein KY289_011734 [Solanum tuberosum]KAH0735453.1 hypothetical protein KY285_011160 [Solanum tuberosum]